MDALARARTLGAIVDRMAALAPSVEHASGRQPTNGTPDPGSRIPDPGYPIAEAGSPIPARPENNGHVEPGPRTLRRVLDVVDAPLPGPRLGLMPGGFVVITEDGR